jgi:glyoxylase-like metal-dependent hydrolase (beta-lactamase superfamily II)
MVTGNGGNSTVRVGQDAVILVDTKNPGDAVFNELMEKIRGISPLPVKYVFITHHHNDHAGNIVSFLPTAKVVAAKELPPLVQRYTPANNARKPSEPNTTYSGKYSAKVKGARVQAFHFAPAHTGGDTIVYFPDVRVVSVGDELVAATPNTDYPFGGSVLGWQKSMAALLKLKFDYAIPGHGDNAMTRAEVEAYAKKWGTFIERARAEIKAGTPKDQLMAKIRTDDLGWNVTTANWTQQDPINQITSLTQANHYTYVGGNPINNTDPAGMVSCSIFGLGGVCKTAKKAYNSEEFWGHAVTVTAAGNGIG